MSNLDLPSKSNGLTPEQRFKPVNARLLNAGIETIHDMDTLRACVGYENANQQRRQVLEYLARRGREIHAADE